MKMFHCLFVAACLVGLAAGASFNNDQDNEVIHKESLGDVYLDRVYDECIATKNAFKCFKYRAVRFLYQVTTPESNRNATLWGPIGLETISADASQGFPAYFDTSARATDSEFDQMSNFALRRLERFMSTHALSWTPSDSLTGARFIDTSEDPKVETEEARGKKKKKIKMLVPLLLFLKLKVLLKLILIKVIFIKKMLIIGGALLLPTIIGQKIMKLKEVIATPVHHSSHSYEDHSGGGYGHGGDSYKQYGRMNKRAALDAQDAQDNAAQDMAYQAYVYKV